MAESGRRRTHRKVRTGCITCKIRRVKCDEEKPACRRCRSTGRRCDGYAFYPPASSYPPDDPTGGAYDGKVLIPQKVKPAAKFSHLEMRGLEYFQRNTIRALSSFVETELWSRLLLQLGESEPAIKHGMIAFSAFHELAASHGFDAVRKGSTGADDFALREYNVAIGQLWRHLSSGNASKTVALVACLLFVCLEFVRGDRDTAITHLRNGMAILRLQPNEELDGSHREIQWGTADESIAPVFARITLVQTILGQPRESRYMDFLTLPQAPPLGYFLSIEEARCSMVNLVNASHSFSYMTENNCFADEAAVLEAQSNILAELEMWFTAFAPFLSPTDNTDTRGAQLMQSTAVLCKLWTSRANSDRETDFDAYTPLFKEIVDQIESVLTSTRASEDEASIHAHTFSVDTGILSNLFFTAVKCRDRALRRRARRLLALAPRREGLWDAVEIAKLTDFIIAVEEEALPPMPSDDVPAEEARVADFSLKPRDPAMPRRQLVLLSRRRFDGDQDIDLMRADYLLYDD